MQIDEEVVNNYQFVNDEFDVKDFIYFILRHRFPIVLYSVLGTLLGVIYALFSQKIWLGQFQIVLDEKKSQTELSSTLLSLTGTSSSKDLATEVEILKSPSILLNVFKFAQEQDNGQYESFRFNQWKKNLEVKLKKNTRVLDIKYKDKNKSLILPILNKISDQYQLYALRKKTRNIELGRNYFEDQIKKYKNKSANSLKNAQEFAIEQDLIYIDVNNQDTIYKNSFSNSNTGDMNFLNRNANLSPSKFIFSNMSNMDIERIRVEAANKIRQINLQLKEIDGLSYTVDDLIYFGSNFPALKEQGLPQKIDDIEDQLILLRKKYTENDIRIKTLIERKKDAIDRLKNKAINYLKAEKLQAESKMKAATRPKDVLFRYKFLIREAFRDESTLISLENNLRQISLDEAKENDPWKLITSPSIFPYPIWPAKNNIIFLGFSAGLILGLIICCIVDIVKGKIYNLQLLKNKFKYPLLLKLDLNNKLKWHKKIEILISGKLDAFKKDFVILYLGKVNKEILDSIEKTFSKILNNQAIRITCDLSEASKCSNTIVVMQLGEIKYDDLEDFQETINIKKTNIMGSIVFDLNKINFKK